MHILRWRPLALLALLILVGGLIGPAAAAADPLSAWTADPSASGDDTYDGFIDQPTLNATVPNGNFVVSGWFVDKTAQGWAGADQIQVWLGTMDAGGKMLANAIIAQNRPDVAAAEGSPFFAASGYSAVVPSGALSAGGQTLSVYAHTPGKGWWYKQVQVNVSGAAAASTASAPASSPVPAAAAPTVSGGALPIVGIEEPKSGDNISTGTQYQLVGYALDKAAAPNQGVQGTGIDHVYAYMDAEPENGGTSLGDATLAFGDQIAQSSYGAQFASAGWRLTFKPTQFHAGSHTLFVYAHSVVTGKTNLATVSFGILE